MMKLPIAQPPWSGLGKRLESCVRKALFDFNMLETASRLAIAVSGGKDSMSLLFLLKAIIGRGFPHVDLYAIHITGPYSCGASIDTNYLHAICEALEITFITRPSTQQRETLACYPCSRERRKLLFEAAKSVGANIIALGHHRDDNAQTLMLNLFHKGEFAGMLPKITMHNFGITIIRPLIYATEADLNTFAQQYNFARAVCRCPMGQNSMRKKVNALLHEIQHTFPNIRNNLALASLTYGSEKANTDPGK